MKILYLDLNMGAAGDMLAASLIDLLDCKEEFSSRFREMNIPSVTATVSSLVRGGICGKSFSVCVNGTEEDEHCHGHSMHHIGEIIESISASEDIKKDILGVYNIIAEAESMVHGTPVHEVHFHEVGMLDAVADIAAVCLAVRMLAPDRIIASPIHVGSGQVRCAHGILPVPAPATAEILKGVPIYGGKIKGELCTPTGAALLRYFVSTFGDMPALAADKIGYGMGKREFEEVNCVRAIFGESENESGRAMVELRANLDDMTGEDIAFAAEQIFKSGALDVWTQSIGMKKSRPGTMLCALCEKECADEVRRAMFRHTTTLGVREISCVRHELSRESENVVSELGTVRKKVSRGFGTEKEKFEYEDIAALAEKSGKSIAEIRKFFSGMGE